MHRTEIFRRGMACALAATLGATAPVAALAQTCPPGYYYASDGNCYRGPPPDYPPPAYDTAPPASAPPVVTDGLLIGLGLLLGVAISGDHDDHHAPPERHRPPPKHAPPKPYGPYDHERR